MRDRLEIVLENKKHVDEILNQKRKNINIGLAKTFIERASRKNYIYLRIPHGWSTLERKYNQHPCPAMHQNHPPSSLNMNPS